MKDKQLKHSVADAGDHARDAAADAVAATQGLIGRVSSFISPKVAEARERVEPLVADAIDRAAPHVAEVGEKVAPYYEKTREAVVSGYDKNVKPHVQEFIDKASENEHLARAAHQGSDAVDKLTSRIDLPTPAMAAPKKKRHRLLKGLGVLAVVGGVVVAVRQLLLPKDDGWTPQEPSTAYTDDDASYAYEPSARSELKEDSADTEPGGASKLTEPDTATEHLEPANVTVSTEESDLPGGVPDQDSTAGANSEKGSADTREETVDAEPTLLDEANDSHEPTTGYRGDNPPEGYTIKGNDRSMKFHVPGGAGYARTNADVWFTTVEEAEAAGFTKASR